MNTMDSQLYAHTVQGFKEGNLWQKFQACNYVEQRCDQKQWIINVFNLSNTLSWLLILHFISNAIAKRALMSLQDSFENKLCKCVLVTFYSQDSFIVKGIISLLVFIGC